MSEKFKDILDFCVKHQLQRHKPRFLNIFAIRPFHSALSKMDVSCSQVLKIAFTLHGFTLHDFQKNSNLFISTWKKIV